MADSNDVAPTLIGDKSSFPIYCSVPLEFVQPWDAVMRLRQIKELGLGNMTHLNIVFHVGNSETDRQRWKEWFPALAAQIDATPIFEARPEHGMAVVLELPLEVYLEQLQLCRELGLAVMCYPRKRTDLSAHEAALMTAAGEGCVLADGVFMESLSKLCWGHSLENLSTAHITPTGIEAALAPEDEPFQLPGSVEQLDMQLLHDWFLHPFRMEIKKLRAMGARHIMAIEASTQIHLAMEAGCDLPLLELVPHDVYPGLAATRGAAKAYGAPFWGVHTALGYYQAPTDERTARRLQIAYNLFYAAGAGLFSEPNIAFHNVGLCSGFFTIPASPPQRPDEEECRSFDDPVCVLGREVLADHYRFTQFHRRPASGPRVKMGFVMGHLDGYTSQEQEHVWCVADAAFATGEAEATWRHFDHMHDSQGWYEPPRKYYWQADPTKPLRHGTPPCGQLDIVPLESPLEVLATYKCLVFLGWNTMLPEYYEKLKSYVQQGGRLLLSVPHLATNLRRDQPLQLLQNGDFRDLFGARVLGSGEQAEEILIVEPSAHQPYALPVGALYLEDALLANVELDGARVLARSRSNDRPVLLENRCGDGLAWLLATWEYPGTRLTAFVTDLLRTLAEGEQDGIAVEGEGIDYSLYDSTTSDGRKLTTIYLVNKSIYGRPQYPCLHLFGARIPMRVEGYGMRIAWVYADELLFAPFDRFVQVGDVVRVEGGYRVQVLAEPGNHEIQLALLNGTLSHIEVNGVGQVLVADREGATTFQCFLEGASTLHIYL